MTVLNQRGATSVVILPLMALAYHFAEIVNMAKTQSLL
jgi:hypothetical protein